MFRTSQTELPLLPGLAIITVCLVLTFLIWKKGRSPWLWCIPLGLLLAGSYAVNLYAMLDGTVYGGLRNDQSFVVAYTNNVIRGNYLGDFFDKEVPAHYPPLLFWVVGTAARTIGCTGVEIWRYLPLIVLFALPFLGFAVGRQLGGDRVGFYSCFALVGIGGFHTQFYFGQGDPLALAHYGTVKPYELLGALLLISWLISHVRGWSENRTPSAKWIVAQGILSGAVLLLYHPWFAIGIATLGAYGLFAPPSGRRGAYLGRLAIVTAIGLAVSSVFWLRYLLAWIELGAERNYQLQPINLYQLDPTWITFGMGYFGLLFFLGFAGFTQLKRYPALKVLLIATGMVYLWFSSTFVTHPLLGISFLPVKTHLALLPIFAVASGVGLQLVADKLTDSRWRSLLQPVALTALALFMAPNALRWNPQFDALFKRGMRPLPDAVREIGRLLDERGGPTIVGGDGMHEICAISSVRPFTAPNIHYANPVTKYKARIASVRDAAAATMTGADLDSALERLGIDGILLSKGPARDLYIVFGYRRGATERVQFDEGAFDAEHFENVFENELLVLYLRK